MDPDTWPDLLIAVLSSAPATPVSLHLTKGAQNPEGVYAYMSTSCSSEFQGWSWHSRW